MIWLSHVIVPRRPYTQCQSNLHIGLSLYPEPQILLFLRCWEIGQHGQCYFHWQAWVALVGIWWPSLLNTNLPISIDEKDLTFTLCIRIFKQFLYLWSLLTLPTLSLFIPVHSKSFLSNTRAIWIWLFMYLFTIS